MSTESPRPAVQQPKSTSLILTLGIIAMLAGFFVVMTVQLTAPRIALNEQRALEKALFAVLPEASSSKNFLLDETGLHPLAKEDIGQANVFAGYTAEGDLAGVAMEGDARGYQDVVKVLYGYAIDSGCVIGMTVLQSTETPGLGDKVSTDPDFLANFDCLEARLNEDGTAMAHEIVTVKNGNKTQPWQIDGISGATVTSTAIGTALRESTNEMLPLLMKYKEALLPGMQP
jgi:electron transport complex protein RnfG